MPRELIAGVGGREIGEERPLQAVGRKEQQTQVLLQGDGVEIPQPVRLRPGALVAIPGRAGRHVGHDRETVRGPRRQFIAQALRKVPGK
jgi:hypothetical protein